MKPRRATAARPKQPTPEELRDAVLEFISRHFYRDARIEFLKDRPRLLQWVVLWPASWLNERGVTLPASRYQEILIGPKGILMEAIRHGDTISIAYRPAWLKKCLQSHFAVQGERIYEEAKGVRNLAEQVLLSVGRSGPVAPDPIRQLAEAASLLKSTRRPAFRRSPKGPVQQDLFGL